MIGDLDEAIELLTRVLERNIDPALEEAIREFLQRNEVAA